MNANEDMADLVSLHMLVLEFQDCIADLAAEKFGIDRDAVNPKMAMAAYLSSLVEMRLQ